MMNNQMTAHGCMTCSKCGRPCPICGTCKCSKEINNPCNPYTPTTTIPVKCEMCGSTTIDHTEIHCQMNRTFKGLNKLKDKGTKFKISGDIMTGNPDVAPNPHKRDKD